MAGWSWIRVSRASSYISVRLYEMRLEWTGER